MTKEKHLNPQFTLRIPEELLHRVKYIAAYHGRTTNKEIEAVLWRYVNSFERRIGDIPSDDLKIV